jgi:hypothetical protein
VATLVWNAGSTVATSASGTVAPFDDGTPSAPNCDGSARSVSGSRTTTGVWRSRSRISVATAPP